MSAPYTALELINLKSHLAGFSEFQLRSLLEKVADQLIEKIDEEISLSNSETLWDVERRDLGEEIETLQTEVAALKKENAELLEKSGAQKYIDERKAMESALFIATSKVRDLASQMEEILTKARRD